MNQISAIQFSGGLPQHNGHASSNGKPVTPTTRSKPVMTWRKKVGIALLTAYLGGGVYEVVPPLKEHRRLGSDIAALTRRPNDVSPESKARRDTLVRRLQNEQYETQREIARAPFWPFLKARDFIFANPNNNK